MRTANEYEISAEYKPSAGELREALNFPNGWVYRIDSAYSDSINVPPGAIIGAWKVNELGLIVGDFIINPNYSKEFCLSKNT